jgi:SAM-dependent methyltransferase
MHAEAWAWLQGQIQPGLAQAARVIDLGGCDVNGSPRELFSRATDYYAVDNRAGPGVRLVTDATTWLPPPELRGSFDVALCTEVFEHVQHWRALLYNLWLCLRPGGVCLVTCATDPRPAHSIVGVVPPPPGEWYGNVTQADLRAPMQALLRDVRIDIHPRGDLYGRGVR